MMFFLEENQIFILKVYTIKNNQLWMKFSVIMASFLQMPQRTNLDLKFKRSVKSYINQTYEDKELIIVSDGCEITNKLYQENFSDRPDIQLISLPKQEYYSGIIRNIAFEYATGDIITYLDADDVIGKNHLKIISEQFDMDKWDWVYSDDYMVLNKEFSKLHTRVVEPRWSSIGTSSISHKHPRLLKNGEYLKWGSGYGHDFLVCLKLAALGLNFKKLEKMPEYIVAHYFQGDF
jgi:glycosyltransferase involved in cell wall biosynthesis